MVERRSWALSEGNIVSAVSCEHLKAQTVSLLRRACRHHRPQRPSSAGLERRVLRCAPPPGRREPHGVRARPQRQAGRARQGLWERRPSPQGQLLTPALTPSRSIIFPPIMSSPPSEMNSFRDSSRCVPDVHYCAASLLASPREQALLVRQLYLLPRFHLSVRGALEARPPDVVELSQPLPRSMLLIQEAIVSVTQALLKDLKSCRQVRSGAAGMRRVYSCVCARRSTSSYRRGRAVPSRTRTRSVAQALRPGAQAKARSSAPLPRPGGHKRPHDGGRPLQVLRSPPPEAAGAHMARPAQ